MSKSILNKILDKFSKDDSVKSFNEVDNFKDQKHWLTTGSPLLDYELNTYGFPIGIIEIRGESKSGKTTFSLHALKAFLKHFKEEGVAAILSTERRDNKPYAKAIGVDTDQVIIAQCKSIEDVYNKAQQIITATEEVWKAEQKSGKPKFIFVWDSLGASISEQEKKKMAESAEDDNAEDQGRAAMGAAARANKRGMRFFQGEIYDKDIWFIIINHTYDNIGGFAGGKKSYGGNGIEYMPTMRLNITRTGFETLREVKRGQKGYVEAIKSDFNSNLGKIPIEINLGRGLVLTKEEIEYAVGKGILEQKGKNGFSFMKGKLEWSSRAQLYDIQDSNNPLYSVLVNKISSEYNKDMLINRKKYDESVEKNKGTNE